MTNVPLSLSDVVTALANRRLLRVASYGRARGLLRVAIYGRVRGGSRQGEGKGQGGGEG